jgi:YggT family protein
MVLSLVIKVLNIVLGLLGLILIVRIVLHLFRVSAQNPALRVIKFITDPVIELSGKILGIPPYRRHDLSEFGASAMALIVVWVVRTLIVWLLELLLFAPVWFRSPLDNFGAMLIFILRLVFDLYNTALLVRILFAWIRVPYASRVMRFLWDITEPLLAPIRSVLPVFGGLDFSPLVAFFLLSFVQRLVFTLLGWIF